MNKIFEPNFTQIPNVVFDYWMYELTPAEFKVLLCLCRKTFGWNKTIDAVSLSQIEKMTGLHRSGIINNLKKLIDLGLVVKTKSKSERGDPGTNLYEINVYSVEGGSILSRLGVVESVDQGVVESVDIQKKDYTKQRHTNIAQSPQSGASPEFYFCHQALCFLDIQEQDLKDWSQAYQYVDVNAEIIKAEQWLRSNPSKARKKLWRKFLTTWLQRSNDSAENKAAYRSQYKEQPKPSGAHAPTIEDTQSALNRSKEEGRERWARIISEKKGLSKQINFNEKELRYKSAAGWQSLSYLAHGFEDQFRNIVSKLNVQ